MLYEHVKGLEADQRMAKIIAHKLQDKDAKVC